MPSNTLAELPKDRWNIPGRSYFERYYMTRTWQTYSHILSLAVSRSAPGALLDIGAGVGYLVEAASQWGLFCIGLEGSPDAITLGKVRNPDLNMVGYRIGQPLPFRRNVFQTIFINQVIEHLEEEVGRICLRECFDALRPGGMLFIASPCRFNTVEVRADSTHVRAYSPGELQSLVNSCGFINVTGLNEARLLLGASRIGRFLLEAAFRLVKWDFLSSSANCLAYKPAVVGPTCQSA